MKKQLFEHSKPAIRLILAALVLLFSQFNALGQCPNPPAISSHPPANKTICIAASTEIIGVSLTNPNSVGSATWYKDGVPIPTTDTRFFGQRSTTLFFQAPRSEAAHQGSYYCVITGRVGSGINCGSVVLQSNTSVVTVNDVVTITGQSPASQTVCQGTPVNLFVQTTGKDLTYQWSRFGSGISGATSSTYSPPIAGDYTVKISNFCSFAGITSSTMTVGMVGKPTVISNPSGVVACAGETKSFSVLVSNGSNLRWQKDGSNLVDGGNISGSTTNNLTISNINASTDVGTYKLTGNGVLACSGETFTSGSATLSVNDPIVISSVSSSQTACEGQNVTFSVTATGTINSYQWKKGGQNIVGQTGSSLTLNNVTTANEGEYSVDVLGPCGNQTRAGIILSVSTTKATLTTISANATKCLGESHTFTASGNNVGSYKWFKGDTELSDRGNISGSGTNSLTLSNLSLTDNGNYKVKVFGTGTCINQSVTSDAITLTVSDKLNAPIITPPTNLSVCEPNNLTLTASCSTGTVVWSNSATGTTLTISAVGTYAFSAKCVSSVCESDASSITNLEIKAKPSSPTVTPPTNLSVCEPTNLTLTANCSTGTVVWSNGATGTTLTISAVGTYAISAKCLSNGCESDASSITNLEIKAKPSSPTVTPPTTLSVCQPNNLTLTASCSTGTVVWSNSATGTTLTISAVGTYAFSAKCLSNGCESEASSITNLEIKAKPSSPTVTPPTTLSVCQPNTLTLTASCSTGTVVWSNSATGNTLTISAVGTYAISAKCLSNGCESDASSITNLEIKAKPTSPTITPPTTLSVCQPNNLTLTASCSTGTVVWSNSATGNTLTVSAVGTYAFSAKCVSNGCESEASSITNLEIKALPNTQASNTGPYEIASTIQLNASEGIAYSWTGPNGFSSIQQNPSIFNAQPSKGGIYTISVTNQSGCVGVATTLVTINTPDPCTQILQYSYVLSGNPHQYLFALTDGMTINQNTKPTSIMVRPVCSRIPVESVTMILSNGTRTWETLQNIEPYAIFDNEGTAIRGEILPAGTYTLTVTGYSQDNRQGSLVYGPIVTTFTIVGNAPTISQAIISKTEICASSTFEVGFTTTGSFLNGNLFQVILSDKEGKFDNFQVIGTNNTTTNIICTIPLNIEYGESYRIKIISIAPFVDGISNAMPLTIHPKDLSLVSPQNDFPFGKKTRKATDTITATNNHTGDAKITYQAGKSIIFLPGFNVSNVSPVFTAEIKTCE